MKNNFLLLSCLLFTTSLVAQNTTTWFPPGAKWQYSYESISGPGLEIFENVGTKVIAGHACAKLHWYGYHQGSPGGLAEYGYRYMYAQNDSVFMAMDVGFVLLYDFTRQVGDTITPSNPLYEIGIIDSTGTTTVLDIPVSFQDISLYSANLPYPLHTRVYERLGGQHLIYWDIESPITEIQYSLECYRDDEYPNSACDSLVIATSNPKDLNIQWKIYPNPATDAITLELPADAVPALAWLFDAQGRELGRREITAPFSQWTLPAIGVSKMLFLHLQTPDGRTAGRVLRIHHY